MIERKLSADNMSVELHRKAVGESASSMMFHERFSFGRSLDDDYQGIVNSYPVDVVDLPAHVASCGAKQLLLKIHVEVAEELIFPKLCNVLPRKTFLFFETHAGGESWNMITKLLHEFEFASWLILDRDFVEMALLSFCDFCMR